MDRLTKRGPGGLAYCPCTEVSHPMDCYGCVKCDKSLEKLAQYEDAEEEGRLIILPCKMGDTVWHVYSDGDIVESRISMLQQKADKTWKVRLSDYWGVHDVNINEIGKTIFPTREAAEATLGGDGDGT